MPDTAHIIPSETDPEHGTRYALKHADGREALTSSGYGLMTEWTHAESYSPELLWADWSAGNVEWSPF